MSAALVEVVAWEDEGVFSADGVTDEAVVGCNVDAFWAAAARRENPSSTSRLMSSMKDSVTRETPAWDPTCSERG